MFVCLFVCLYPNRILTVKGKKWKDYKYLSITNIFTPTVDYDLTWYSHNSDDCEQCLVTVKTIFFKFFLITIFIAVFKPLFLFLISLQFLFYLCYISLFLKSITQLLLYTLSAKIGTKAVNGVVPFQKVHLGTFLIFFTPTGAYQYL